MPTLVPTESTLSATSVSLTLTGLTVGAVDESPILQASIRTAIAHVLDIPLTSVMNLTVSSVESTLRFKLRYFVTAVDGEGQGIVVSTIVASTYDASYIDDRMQSSRSEFVGTLIDTAKQNGYKDLKDLDQVSVSLFELSSNVLV